MSVDEIKKMVHQQVDALSETQLQEVNLFIERINSNAANNSVFLQHALQIMEDRKNVLEKLAQ